MMKVVPPASPALRDIQGGPHLMPDPRWETLAEILIDHSTRLAAGETLLIECFDLDDSTLPRLLVQKAARKGA